MRRMRAAMLAKFRQLQSVLENFFIFSAEIIYALALGAL